MRSRLSGLVWAVLAGAALIAAAWFGPALLDGPALADTMLRESFKLPEVVASYVPELVGTLRLSTVAAASCPLAGFLIFVALTVAIHPTGPGQVGRSWRLGLWLVLLVAVAVSSYLLAYFGMVGRLEAIDELAATRVALAEAAGAAIAFWALSLIGTERMTRPAVPLAGLLMRSA